MSEIILMERKTQIKKKDLNLDACCGDKMVTNGRAFLVPKEENTDRFKISVKILKVNGKLLILFKTMCEGVYF